MISWLALILFLNEPFGRFLTKSVIAYEMTFEDSQNLIWKGMNAKDVRKLDIVICRQLTTKDVNRIISPKACHGFTAECLAQFKITNLNPDCAMSLSSRTFHNLPKKTFLEMLQSDAHHISFTPYQLGHMLKKFEFSVPDFPAVFTSYVARNKRLAIPFIKILDRPKGWPLLNLLLSPQNVPRLDPCLFALLSKKTVKHLNPQAFREMSKEQFSYLHPSGLADLTPAQISQMQPRSFEAFTKRTLQTLSKEAFRTISADQARSFGTDPAQLPLVKEVAQNNQREMEILDRRMFFENHPCLGIYKLIRKYKTASAFNDAIHTRCSVFLYQLNMQDLQVLISESKIHSLVPLLL
jgi:hypothetical protein